MVVKLQDAGEWSSWPLAHIIYPIGNWVVQLLFILCCHIKIILIHDLFQIYFIRGPDFSCLWSSYQLSSTTLCEILSLMPSFRCKNSSKNIVTYYSFHTEFFCLSTKHAKILSLQVNFRNSTNLMSNIVAMLYFLGCHIKFQFLMWKLLQSRHMGAYNELNHKIHILLFYFFLSVVWEVLNSVVKYIQLKLRLCLQRNFSRPN